MSTSGRIRALALVTGGGLLLSACSGAKVGETQQAAAGGGTACGTFNLAVNPWGATRPTPR